MTANKPLYFAVNFHRPEYHGLRDNRSCDWPPSPLRLIGALVSGAYKLGAEDRESALDVIQRLLHCPPPTIHVPRTKDLQLPETYAQASGFDAGGPAPLQALRRVLDLSLLGMTTASRTAKPVTGIQLDSPWVIFQVEGEFDEGSVAVLAQAAQRVGYFGRSNDPAELYVSATALVVLQDSDHGFRSLRPIPDTRGQTRGWTPLSLEWMDENYSRMFAALDGGHLALPPIPPEGFVQPLRYIQSWRSGVTEIVALDRAVPNHQVPKLMDSLEQRTQGLDSVRVKVFPVVFAAFEHADGRCMGIGFTADLEGKASPAALLDVQSFASEAAPMLWDPDLLGFQTGLVPQESSRTLKPSRWEDEASTWTSATPYRGFPDRMVVEYTLRHDLEAQVGVPVTKVTASAAPSAPWEHRWRQDLFADGLTDWWLEIEFERDVSGPLLASTNQKFGTGVFVQKPRASHHELADGYSRERASQ